jgi:aspartyl-tRNA(Asn)/glutamyl-tRNA(Gln) amidotransferase subunit A
VKDLFDTAGIRTTYGSAVFGDHVPVATAPAVARLEAQGWVNVGKANLHEFAYGVTSQNLHYGVVPNPAHPGLTAGGSSGGSAAALVLGEADAALGTDTGGSIRIPAAACGVVGLKPTFGRISLHGAVPLAWSLDHLGPLARTVGDAALLLEALAGYDPRDPRTRGGVAQPTPPDLDAGVAGLRVGVLGDDGSGRPLGAPEALAAWQAGLNALARAGAELVPIDLPELEALRLINGAILAIEASTFHCATLRGRLEDYGEFMRQRIIAAFAYDSRALSGAQQARAMIRRRCDALFEQIDLLSTPTLPDGAPALGTPGWTTFTGPFNALGWPAISVPVGLTAAGLPLGMQIIGRPWDEATLLRAARAVEAGRHALTAPADPYSAQRYAAESQSSQS